MTNVFVDGSADGFQSISWNINRQPNRLWQLGSWTPWKTQVAATLSISLTSYAGALSSLVLSPSVSCDNSNAKKTIVIDAQTCDTGAVSINEAVYINSYSYSKGDPVGFGTESWSFQKWIESGVVGTEFVQIPEPTYVLQGRAEGSRQGTVGNGNTDLGITFLSPESTHVVEGQQGSVSAGFPGTGNADTIKLGLVSAIGGGKLESGGDTGQSSATIPHQPLYLG